MTGEFPPAKPTSDRNDSYDPKGARERIAELREVLDAAKRRALHDQEEGNK